MGKLNHCYYRRRREERGSRICTITGEVCDSCTECQQIIGSDHWPHQCAPWTKTSRRMDFMVITCSRLIEFKEEISFKRWQNKKQRSFFIYFLQVDLSKATIVFLIKAVIILVQFKRIITKEKEDISRNLSLIRNVPFNPRLHLIQHHFERKKIIIKKKHRKIFFYLIGKAFRHEWVKRVFFFFVLALRLKDFKHLMKHLRNLFHCPSDSGSMKSSLHQCSNVSTLLKSDDNLLKSPVTMVTKKKVAFIEERKNQNPFVGEKFYSCFLI